jgi:hypothetical protein
MYTPNKQPTHPTPIPTSRFTISTTASPTHLSLTLTSLPTTPIKHRSASQPAAIPPRLALASPACQPTPHTSPLPPAAEAIARPFPSRHSKRCDLPVCTSPPHPCNAPLVPRAVLFLGQHWTHTHTHTHAERNGCGISPYKAHFTHARAPPTPLPSEPREFNIHLGVTIAIRFHPTYRVERGKSVMQGRGRAR